MPKKYLFFFNFLSILLFLTAVPVAIDSFFSLASAAEYKTPTFGGTGGKHRYNLDCGKKNVMVGFTYKAALWVDAIGLICQRVKSDGTLGEEFTKGPVGGPGGSPKIRRCKRGKVVYGLSARYHNFIQKIYFKCSKWSASLKTPKKIRQRNKCNKKDGEQCLSFGDVSGGVVIGNTGKFLCPPDKVGKAIRGKHGWYIDNMRFVCDKWNK